MLSLLIAPFFIWQQTELWFSSETVQNVPEDPSEPLPFNRLANLRKVKGYGFTQLTIILNIKKEETYENIDNNSDIKH